MASYSEIAFSSVYKYSNLYKTLLDFALVNQGQYDMETIENNERNDFDKLLSEHKFTKQYVTYFLSQRNNFNKIRFTSDIICKCFHLLEFFRYDDILHNFANHIVNKYITNYVFLDLIWQYPSIQYAIQNFFANPNILSSIKGIDDNVIFHVYDGKNKNDKLLEYVSKYISIQKLVCGDEITNNGLEYVAEEIDTLILNCHTVQYSISKNVANKMRKLKVLYTGFFTTNITSECYKNSIELIELHAKNGKYINGDLQNLCNLEILRSPLNILNNEFQTLTKLKFLDISHSDNVTDEGLKYLFNIEVLIVNKNITDNGIIHMTKLRKLIIKCTTTQITGSCFEFLPKLTDVYGINNTFLQRHIEFIANDRVKLLGLDSCVDNVDTDLIKKMSNLEELIINNCENIDEQEVIKCLPKLRIFVNSKHTKYESYGFVKKQKNIIDGIYRDYDDIINKSRLNDLMID